MLVLNSKAAVSLVSMSLIGNTRSLDAQNHCDENIIRTEEKLGSGEVRLSLQLLKLPYASTRHLEDEYIIMRIQG